MLRRLSFMLKVCFAEFVGGQQDANVTWPTREENFTVFSLLLQKSHVYKFFWQDNWRKKTNMNYKVINMMNSFCICLKNIQIAIEPLR